MWYGIQRLDALQRDISFVLMLCKIGERLPSLG
jgi:hypothetical protein